MKGLHSLVSIRFGFFFPNFKDPDKRLSEPPEVEDFLLNIPVLALAGKELRLSATSFFVNPPAENQEQMMPDNSAIPCRILLIRPTIISGDKWDAIVQTLMQLSDRQVVLTGIVDPAPSPDILIVAEMDGIPIAPRFTDIAPGSFTHIAMEDGLPDILSSSGIPWPRVSFTVIALLAEQVASKNQFMAIFNRYRAFAQSLTNLIPLDKALPYESLICQSLRTLLSASAVAYCESRVRTRSMTIRTSDPKNLFKEDDSFPLTESLKAILTAKTGYFDDLDPEKTGILHLPQTASNRVVVFRLIQGSSSTIPFLLIFPPPFPPNNPIPEFEFQNALELSAPVLQTSHALFAHRLILKRKAEHDSLTKILNRDSLDSFLTFTFQNARANQEPLSLLMLDIDHFKQVNDTYGHGVVDSVLIDVTGAIGKTLRSGDGFGRYGGEEFVVILPGLEKTRAVQIAERIRNSVRKLIHPIAGKITLSIGIASFPEDVSRESELIPLADRMMYEAKHKGRDRVHAL